MQQHPKIGPVDPVAEFEQAKVGRVNSVWQRIAMR